MLDTTLAVLWIIGISPAIVFNAFLLIVLCFAPARHNGT